MISRWLAFVVWALVGFSAMAWLLRLAVPSSPVPTHALAVDGAAALRGDMSRLLGAAPVAEVSTAAPAPIDTRLKLLGVVAGRGNASASASLALISVDGKPARAYRVGASVDGERVLLAVRSRGVDIGARGASPSLSLEIAPLAAAATGTLPGANQPAAPPPSAVPAAAEASPQPAQEQPPGPPPIVPQLPQLPQLPSSVPQPSPLPAAAPQS